MKVYLVAPLAHRFDQESKEKFIELVNSVDLVLKKFKLSTYLTYRDFLRWGKVAFNPKTVFEKFMMELKAADLLLAIHPNEGIGSNIALGAAAALKKRMIIILDKNFDLGSHPGLMYKGFKNITECEIIVHDDKQDLLRKLRLVIKNFLKTKNLSK